MGQIRDSRGEFRRREYKKGRDAAPMIVGVAGDSGSGKSQFMKRIMGMLGSRYPKGHTPKSDLVTIICLDDYRKNDRIGRQLKNRSALHPDEQHFDQIF